MVKSGWWHRLHIGVYAIAGVPLTYRSTLRAALLAAGGEAFLSHRSAAAFHMLERFQHMRLVEVTVPHRRRLRIPAVVVHRPRIIVPGDVVVCDTFPVSSVTRTLFDLAAVLPIRAVEPAMDDALRRGITTIDAIHDRLTCVSRPGVRGLRKIAGALAERVDDPITESHLESMLIRVLKSAGLPVPISQHEVFAHDGALIGRVDFAFPELRLAIEIDGYGFHSGKVAFERDRARQNALVAQGWTVLRFTKSDLVLRHREVAAQIAALLGTLSSGTTDLR
jgi:hypothetical protein